MISPAIAISRPPSAQVRTTAALALVVAHVPIALALHAVPMLAAVHAVGCLVIGVVAAGSRRAVAAPTVLGYIAGSEVLWRMSRAPLFWEFGKLATSIILVVAVSRVRVVRNRYLAIAYIVLLLPSIALTVAALDIDTARQEVSFNLLGPLALALAVVFFANLRGFTTRRLVSVAVAFIAPVVGIATLSLVSVITHHHVGFANAANSVTSGGFGPNEVSAALGLGAMFAVLLTIDRELPWRFRMVMLGLGIALAVLATLTFARGGIVLAVAGTCGALFVLLRGNASARVTVIGVGLVVFAIARYAVAPALESFTGGQISHRYTSTTTSGRDRLIASELAFFAESPVFGVGPGVGMMLRRERGLIADPSHTEYTRMLAEHGIFGVLSLGCLVALGARAIRTTRNLRARAYAVAMITWVGLILLVYATRVVAPSFVMGLAFSVWGIAPTKPSAA